MSLARALSAKVSLERRADNTGNFGPHFGGQLLPDFNELDLGGVVDGVR